MSRWRGPRAPSGWKNESGASGAHVHRRLEARASSSAAPRSSEPVGDRARRRRAPGDGSRAAAGASAGSRGSSRTQPFGREQLGEHARERVRPAGARAVVARAAARGAPRACGRLASSALERREAGVDLVRQRAVRDRDAVVARDAARCSVSGSRSPRGIAAARDLGQVVVLGLQPEHAARPARRSRSASARATRIADAAL